MAPLLKKLPRPLRRMSFLEMKLLGELCHRADEHGLLDREAAADLLDHVGGLVRAGQVVEGARYLGLTCRLSPALRRERKRNRRRRVLGAEEDWAVARRVVELLPELRAVPVVVVVEKQTPEPPRLSRAEYTVLLARVLQVEKISPQVHSLLTYLAGVKAQGRRATMASTMDELGCTYHAIQHHVMRVPGNHRGASGKHEELFTVDRKRSPFELGISQMGVEVLMKVDGMVKRYAERKGR